MIDIETVGLDPGCSIISIGAVTFDAHAVHDEFYRSVSLESCQEAGLTIDAGTLDWWLHMDGDTKDQLKGGDELETVLQDLADWLVYVDEVWANSPSFDCEILSTAYESVDMAVPWEYYEERDFRTLKNLPLAPEIEHDGDEHDALDDARHQATVAIKTLEKMEQLNEAQL